MFHYLKTLFGNSDGLPPPTLDGVWGPNDLLEGATIVAQQPDVDCLAISPSGKVCVSAQNKVLGLHGGQLVETASFAGPVTAIACLPDGCMVVAVEGQGLIRLDQQGRSIALQKDAVRCITAIAVDPGGRVFFTQGSESHPADEWCQDLMRLGSTGRIGEWQGDGSIRWLVQNLRYPSGIAVAANGDLIFSEAWAHTLSRVRADGSNRQAVLENLAGYPSRLSAAAGGGLFLTLFAMRTLLVDFVLTEKTFREEMIETIDPRYWVRPALASGGSYLEPLQGGAIVKLGVRKAWSPPRSYGLMVRLDDEFTPMATWHSRVGGKNHGITAAEQVEDKLFVVSKGGGRLLSLEVA